MDHSIPEPSMRYDGALKAKISETIPATKEVYSKTELPKRADTDLFPSAMGTSTKLPSDGDLQPLTRLRSAAPNS